MTKYFVGDKVALTGNTAKAMDFRKGIIRKIGKTNNGKRIYYVSRLDSTFTTPFLTNNIKKINIKKR